MSTISEQGAPVGAADEHQHNPLRLERAVPAAYQALLLAGKEANSRDAISEGETADRLAVLGAWRDTDYFTPIEKAALALTETVTLVADHQSGRSSQHDPIDALSAEQHAAVRWLAIVIDAFNRVAITSHYEVAPEHAAAS
ncbi:MAG: carboxymuconolactone decarboxylase family protein [Microbacterium sp.]|jgi:alkylhydroperoxidase family enzyme|nr:carboxymuconolactone decarboxylase family protein [Microbacterium sp.]